MEIIAEASVAKENTKILGTRFSVAPFDRKVPASPVVSRLPYDLIGDTFDKVSLLLPCHDWQLCWRTNCSKARHCRFSLDGTELLSKSSFEWVFEHQWKSSCRDFWLHFPLQTWSSVHKLLNSLLHPYCSCTGIQTWIFFLGQIPSWLFSAFFVTRDSPQQRRNLRLSPGLSRLAFPSPKAVVSRCSMTYKLRLWEIFLT